MNKATRIKDFLMDRYTLEPHHFEVDINAVSGGSFDYQNAISDISRVNRIFETRIHGVRIGENWFSVGLIAGGSIADVLIQELNVFLEQIEEEKIELKDNEYVSLYEGLNDFLVKVEGGNIQIYLTWKIE